MDILGRRFGLLEVVGYAGFVMVEQSKNKWRKKNYWYCLCDCGNFCKKEERGLLSKHCRSCGCLPRIVTLARITKHNKHKSKEYRCFSKIKMRCSNPKDKRFHDYGGRGIKICERWTGENDFVNFYTDMGDAPKGTSIERIDNNGNYCPENCRWATNAEQARNKRSNHFITYNGEKICIAEVARRTGINVATIHGRILRGWTEEEAVSVPLGIKIKEWRSNDYISDPNLLLG